MRFRFNLRTVLLSFVIVALSCCFVQQFVAIKSAREQYVYVLVLHDAGKMGLLNAFRAAESLYTAERGTYWISDGRARSDQVIRLQKLIAEDLAEESMRWPDEGKVRELNRRQIQLRIDELSAQ
jgi:hypothetical protein